MRLTSYILADRIAALQRNIRRGNWKQASVAACATPVQITLEDAGSSGIMMMSAMADGGEATDPVTQVYSVAKALSKVVTE